MLELTDAYIKCSTILRTSFKMFLRMFFSRVKPLTKILSGEGCSSKMGGKESSNLLKVLSVTDIFLSALSH